MKPQARVRVAVRCSLIALSLVGGAACSTLPAGPSALIGRSATAAGTVGSLALDGGRIVTRTSSDFAVGAARYSSRMAGDARRLSGRMAIGVMDAGPGPDAGFLPDPARMRQTERADHPFHRVWVAPSLTLEGIDRIHVAPVDTDHVLPNSFWEKLSTAAFFNLGDDPDRLAGRLHAVVVEAFRDDPKKRFVVAEGPGPDTLVLELSLVEVVPNKSVLALGALASFAAPPVIGTPIGAVASLAEHGVLAIEGRVRVGESGEVVAMFADRESGKTRVLDLQTIAWYGHASEIFRDWADQLVAVANDPDRPGMSDPRPMALRPW